MHIQCSKNTKCYIPKQLTVGPPSQTYIYIILVYLMQHNVLLFLEQEYVIAMFSNLSCVLTLLPVAMAR